MCAASPALLADDCLTANQSENYVSFGSLADITGRSCHVRFTPDSGHSSVQVGCPKSAISGHSIEGMWRKARALRLRVARRLLQSKADGVHAEALSGGLLWPIVKHVGYTPVSRAEELGARGACAFIQ
jgi:hypothetical protein